jgi:hypothetical protein
MHLFLRDPKNVVDVIAWKIMMLIFAEKFTMEMAGIIMEICIYERVILRHFVAKVLWHTTEVEWSMIIVRNQMVGQHMLALVNRRGHPLFIAAR